MLSIDEAIARERELAKEQKTKYDKCPTRMRYCCEMCFHNPKCNESAEYYEQLAEWLELLKWYEQGMEDIPSESGVLPKDVYHAGYNKAIDDFLTEICKMIVQSENNGNYRFYAVEIKQSIADLAEQIKGKYNEQRNNNG